MKNQIACLVEYMSPTDHLGARVKLFFPRFKKRRIIPYDHALNSAVDIALAYLAKNHIHPDFEAESTHDHILLIDFAYVEQIVLL